MIDFRYHIVSLIAVFLALGIGIVMGTTVVDRAIVSRLENQLQDLNDEVRNERDQRREIEAQQGDLEKFVTQGSQFFIGNRLARQTVLVLTAEGVDEDLVNGEVEIMRQAGAQVPAVLTLTDKWRLSEQTARDQLQLHTGAPDTDLETLYRYSVVNLAAKLGNAPPTADQVALINPEKAAVLIGNLVQDGFIEVRGVDVQQGLDPNTLGGPASLTVIAGADDIGVPLDDFYIPLSAQMALGRRSMAVQATAPEQKYIGALRADESAAANMSTVDNANTPVGRYSSVVALQASLCGIFEPVGTGEGAVQLVPTRTC